MTASGTRPSGCRVDPGFQNPDEVFSQFADLFGDLFGFGGGGRRGGGGQRARRGADLQFQLELDFLEAIHGATKEVEIPRQAHCDRCDGTCGAREHSGHLRHVQRPG